MLLAFILKPRESELNSCFLDSYFNRIVNLWNSLSHIVKNCATVSGFKNQLKSSTFPVCLEHLMPTTLILQNCLLKMPPHYARVDTVNKMSMSCFCFLHLVQFLHSDVLFVFSLYFLNFLVYWGDRI